MRTETHDERAALALATASFIGDKRAAERHNCSKRTLQDWRKRCETDDSLAAACVRARAKLEGEWYKEVPGALIAAVDFLKKAAQEGDHLDPEMVESISKSVERLSHAELTHRVLDARIDSQDRAIRTGPVAVASRPAA